HSGMAFESLEQDASGVVINLRERGSGKLFETRGDVFVGADDIHSAVRRHFYPHGDEPRFSGRMLWRAVTEAEPYLDGRTMFMAGLQDQKFVAYPIDEPLRQRGRSLINCIAELKVSDGAPPPTDWSRQV